MKRILAAILAAALIFLSGCGAPQGDGTDQSTEATRESEGPQDSAPPQSKEPQVETDPPATDPPKAEAEPLFKYDKYWVTPDAREQMSDREYELYCNIIDSLLDHNGVISGFESVEEYERVREFLFSEFIPVRHIIQSYLNSDDPFSYENGTATFKFLGDKETCTENYNRFESIVNEALALIEKDDGDWERIAKLYLYVSDSMSYGSPYDTYGINADLYSCIVYKLGMCTEYAYFLNLLADHIGFETIDGRSLGKDGFDGADHCWSMIRIDGKWYHFDACWQASQESNENMMYFAISTKDRYSTLAGNSPWGEIGELEMFDQHDYTYVRSELPYCESGLSEGDRTRLYSSVIGDM